MKLYKYRSITSYAMKQLITEAVGFSNILNMNDAYDSVMYLEPEEYSTDTELEDFAGKRKSVERESLWQISLQQHLKNEMNFTNGKEKKLISCFSETVTEPLMWGHYTNSGKGFALEYELKDLHEKVLRFNLCLELAHRKNMTATYPELKDFYERQPLLSSYEKCGFKVKYNDERLPYSIPRKIITEFKKEKD